MSKLNVTGKVDKILPKQEGVSKAGTEWQKIAFILKTDEKWNNVYCFDLFGEDKVTDFMTTRELGSEINVFFNVKTSEYKGRYYTSLDVWKIEDSENSTTEVSRQDEFNNAVNEEVVNEENELIPQTSTDDDDLPF